MNDNTRIAKNTIILNIRLVIVILLGLYTSRKVLQILGVEDFGLYNLVGGFVSLLAIFTSSMTGAAQRFITFELGKGDSIQLKKTFSSIVTAFILLSIIIIIVGLLLGGWFVLTYLNIPPERMHSALVVFGCSIGVFIINLLSVPYIAEVTAHERMDFFAIMSLFDAFGKLIVVLCLKYTGDDHLIEYAIGLLMVSLTSRIIYGIYCSRNFEEAKYKPILDKRVLKGVLSFSAWMGIGSACGILKDQGASILLNIFFGLTLNAAVGIANQVKGLMVAFCNNIGTAISPQITKSYASGDKKRAINLTFFMTKCQGTFMMLIATPLLVEMNYILTLWLGEFPSYSVEFSRMMIIVSFLNSLSMAFGPLFLAEGRIRNYQLVGSSITFLYIPLCYVILRLTDNPMACMIVSIVVESILLITNYICLKVQINFPIIDFFKRVIIPVIAVFTVSTSIALFILKWIPDSSFLRLLTTSSFTTVMIVLLIYAFVLNKNERQLLNNFYKSKIAKWK